jgi:hypothetical protein
MMKSRIIRAFALLGLLSLALPMAASADEQHYSEWNKPAWAYQQLDWWRAYETKHGQPSSYAAQEHDDAAHFRYWREHHRRAADERDYRWRSSCKQDGDNCRPNPYSYGNNFAPPDSLYYRQFNPSYGYMMPWSFYVQPYR